MKRALSLLALIPFFLFSSLAHACDKKDGGVFCRDTAWDNLSSATMIYSDHSEQQSINYYFGKAAMQVTLKSTGGDYNFILVNPGIYIYPKKMPPIDHPFEPVEGFVGQLRLIGRILDSAFPNGPLAIKNKNTINIGSASENLQVVTDAATIGIFGSPWSAKGIIKLIGKNRYHYSLDFAFQDMSSKNAVKYNMTGELNYSPMNFILPNSFRLNDYNIVSLGEHKPNLSHIESIGELKKQLDNAHD